MVVVQIMTDNLELHAVEIDALTSDCECIDVCHHHFVGIEGDSFFVPENYYSLLVEVVDAPGGGLDENGYVSFAGPSV